MYNILGFIVALLFIKSSLDHLNVGSGYYYDEVAAMLVFGGTLATMIITFPPRYLYKFFKAPWQMMVDKSGKAQQNAEVFVKASMQEGNQNHFLLQQLKNPDLDPFLKEGIELLVMGLKREEFKDILTERIYRSRQREEDVVNLFRKLAKYPPAFGLVGTVLGLISLMRSVGSGADASTVGLNMALALTATLYGLAFSNFVLAPIAENFQRVADEKKVFREFLFEGLLLLFDQKDPLSVQEMLNSYIEPSQRLDLLGIRQQEAS